MFQKFHKIIDTNKYLNKLMKYATWNRIFEEKNINNSVFNIELV